MVFFFEALLLAVFFLALLLGVAALTGVAWADPAEAWGAAAAAAAGAALLVVLLAARLVPVFFLEILLVPAFFVFLDPALCEVALPFATQKELIPLRVWKSKEDSCRPKIISAD